MARRKIKPAEAILTRAEAAEYLGLQESTLARWTYTGRYGLRYIKMGGSVRYRVRDLEEFLERRTVGATADTDQE